MTYNKLSGPLYLQSQQSCSDLIITVKVNTRVPDRLHAITGLPVRVISPMITSMKSTHESVPFNHKLVRLYIEQLYANYSIGVVNMRE